MRTHRMVVVTALVSALVFGLTLGVPASASAKTKPPTYQNLKYAKALSWQEKTSWKTCPAPRYPRVSQKQLRILKKRPGKGNRITVVGDSLVHESYWRIGQSLLDKGWLPTIVCWGGKTTPWALKQLRRLHASKRLAPYVVVATGTNDMLFQTTPKRFEQQALTTTRWLSKNTTRFWWINTSFVLSRVNVPRFKPRLAQYRTFNRIISQSLTTVTPQGRLLDWNKRVSRNPRKYIGTDGIHDTATGKKLRARLIGQVRLVSD